MTHPLDQAIATLRAAARRIGLTYGAAWTIASLVGTLVCFGLLDFYLRVDFVPVRLLLSLAAVLTVAVAAWRLLVPSLARPLGDVALAQRLQSRFPALEDRVASAIEFLHQPDDLPTAGSVMLRRAVIVDATQQIRRVAVDEVLDRRPARRALLAAAAAAIAAIALAVAWPLQTRIALTRLANPFGATRWPQVHKLEFRKAPERLASGQLFEVELIDRRGKLPENVQIQYRLDDADHPRIQGEPMRRVGDVMVAHRESVRRSFHYRAVGGDDESMPWHKLLVIEPPRVETLRVTLRPPDYTGWPTETSNGRIAALVGTRLQFQVTSSKPLSKAAFRLESGPAVPGQLAADGMSFVVPVAGAPPLLVKESGNYWFELVDREGITGGGDDRWSMRAVPVDAPDVTLEKPAADLYVTAEADVPVRVLAKHQLALQRIALVFSRSDRSMDRDRQIVLFSGPPKVEPTQQTGLATAAGKGDRRVEEYLWKLAELQLPAATQLLLSATATDYQPVTSQSPSVRIQIITPRQLDDRLARQEAQILNQLAQVVPMQRDARSRVAELQIQLREVGQLLKPDLDRLQGLDLAQRDVRRKLTGGSDAIRGQIDSILRQLADNKINNPEIERRMSGLAALIDALDKAELSAAQRDLASALKDAQVELEDRPPAAGNGDDRKHRDDATAKKPASAATATATAPPSPKAQPGQAGDRRPASATGRNLDDASQQQDRILTALEQSLQELQRWDNYRQFARELSDIESQQQQVRAQTQTQMSRTLGRDPKDLTPQEAADLKKQAEKQLELARRFEKLVAGMRSAGHELEKADPLAAQSIDDALAHAQDTGISRQMRSAGDQVERNQVAAAVGQQQEADRNLQEMLDILANRREQELSRLVKKLREAETQLNDLKQQETALRKKMQQAANQPDPQQRRRELERLSRQQQQLQKLAGRLERQLKRLQVSKAAEKLAGAGSKMGASGEAGQAGDSQRAGDEAAEAQKDLEDAQRQLARARQQAENDLAQEELQGLKDRLTGLRDRQRGLLEETQRLEALRVQQQRLTRGEQVSVADLAGHQSELGGETGEMAQKLAAAEGFSLALKRSADEMARAAAELGRLETGPEPQQAQRRALDRLALVLKALEPDKEDQDAQSGANEPGQNGPRLPQGDAIHSLSELKLLRLMQEDVRARTSDLEERKQTAVGLSPAELKELADLAEEQGRLADLMLKLREPDDTPPENDPDNLSRGKPPTRPDAQENKRPNSEKSDKASRPGLDVPPQDGK